MVTDVKDGDSISKSNLKVIECIFIVKYNNIPIIE